MVLLGVILCYGAALLLLFAVFRSAQPRLPLARRRPVEVSTSSVLSRGAGVVTDAITRALQHRGWDRQLGSLLDMAGLRMSPADFVLLAGVATLVGCAIGLVLGGPVLAAVLLATGPVGAKLTLGFMLGRRRRAFADQLDDTLQLLSGSLRAGHSLLRAIDAVSHEAESPTADELARIVNETRVGRDLNDALNQTSQRMGSDDFKWVGQAIGIHREVGGDLAVVLDQVGQTIRERNQIRRHVKGLSAEGKMSAYILMALPLLVVGALTVLSPGYVNQFFDHVYGYAMIGAAAVMFLIGGLWMRKVVSFTF